MSSDDAQPEPTPLAGQDWTQREVGEVVTDYFAMLLAELYGRPYSKTQHRETLLRRLSNRSHGSVERKHQNISAVLIERGLPYIDGYKPLSNYQRLLANTVDDYLINKPEWCSALMAAPKLLPEDVEVDLERLGGLPLKEDPPDRNPPAVRPAVLQLNGIAPDIAALQTSNTSLQSLGIRFALAIERDRLVSAGRPELAENVVRVSKPGRRSPGYDVRSFSADTGAELALAVKTTALGKYFPFVVTAPEVSYSRIHSDSYSLFRVFSCGTRTRYFTVDGDLSQTFVLDPTEYVASR